MTKDEVVKKLQRVRDHLGRVAESEAQQTARRVLDEEWTPIQCSTIIRQLAQTLRDCVYVENLIRDLDGEFSRSGFTCSSDLDHYYRQLEKLIREATQ